MTSARYVAFEGGEATGKSTQAMRLAADLDAVLTHEPGATGTGARIRAIVLDPDEHALVPRAEALLYAADRAQHTAEVIAPALAAGRCVVSDRSAWSSVVYQGCARGLDAGAVRRLSDWATEGRWPDLVVLLDADPALASRRLVGGLDRIEGAGARFHQLVRKGFLSCAAADPGGWVVIDAAQPVDVVARTVRAEVRERLGL